LSELFSKVKVVDWGTVYLLVCRICMLLVHACICVYLTVHVSTLQSHCTYLPMSERTAMVLLEWNNHRTVLSRCWASFIIGWCGSIIKHDSLKTEKNDSKKLVVIYSPYSPCAVSLAGIPPGGLGLSELVHEKAHPSNINALHGVNYNIVW